MEYKTNRGQTSFLDEIIVDNFAGGGGASTGMELATGRPVDIAINHDPDAILMHKTNHPYTEHLQASVWDVDPREVCRGRPVGLAWFSPMGGFMPKRTYFCSKCGLREKWKWPYCHCGAKMDGGEKDAQVQD